MPTAHSPRLFDKLASVYEIPGTARRIPSMEGLRGLAILLVFWTHYHAAFGAYLSSWFYQASYRVHLAGHAGVDLFFVLSGFLIYGILMERDPNYRRFLVRRAQRLWPAFLAVMLLCLAAIVLLPLPQRNKIPSGLGGAAYLVANLLMLPGFFDIKPLVTVCWSLSYEMVFYVTLPLILRTTGLRGRSRRSRVAAVLAGSATYLWFCYFHGGAIFWPEIHLAPGAHPRMILFACGMIVYEALEAGWRFTGFWRPVALLVTGLAAFTLCYDPPGMMASALPEDQQLRNCLATGALILTLPGFVAAVLVRTSPLARVFGATALRWLGNISYSFYLLHALTLYGLGSAMYKLWPPTGAGRPWLFLLMLPVSFALATVLATVLFAAVEKPYSLAPRAERAGC